CLEFNASGAGLGRFAMKIRRSHLPNSQTPKLPNSETISARDVFAAYDRRDPIARAALDQAIQYWGMAVANLVSLFNPEKIIFGGGVFGPGRRFIPQIRAEAKKWAQPISMK